MIPVARSPLPQPLLDRMAQLTDNLAQVGENRADAARTRWKRAKVRTPLRAVLAEMAHGRERCMYCGDNQGTDVDHHEPIARNPLRTFDWLNHLLACSACNSHYKRDLFPVDGSGRPLLIDPTTEDPFDHLLLTLTLGVYHPLTEKGATTIEVCGLNRPILTRGRTQARLVLGSLLRDWRRAQDVQDSRWMAEVASTIREYPFADVCQAMLRQADRPGADLVFQHSPEVLSLLRLPDLRAALLSHP